MVQPKKSSTSWMDYYNVFYFQLEITHTHTQLEIVIYFLHIVNENNPMTFLEVLFEYPYKIKGVSRIPKYLHFVSILT